MKQELAIDAFSALAQPTRLEAFRLLVKQEPDGLPAGEIARRLDVPHNTMSTHLAILARAGLITVERHSRSMIYRVELKPSASSCCSCSRTAATASRSFVPRSSTTFPRPARHREPAVAERTYNVLFLCTGNSARSIFGEAILNRVGQGRFKAFSAGSHPRAEVHPYADELLEKLDHPTNTLRPKSWDEFAAAGAPELDFVFTVCDDAAKESCPVWLGQPMSAHWGVPDPVAAEAQRLKGAWPSPRPTGC